METDVQLHQSHFDETLINWERIAEPQDDQYDTQITLEYAHRAGYTRRDVGDCPIFFDGQVAIRPDTTIVFALDCIPADPSHPNVSKGSDLLRHWSTVYVQFQQLVDSVSLFFYTPHSVDLVVGSICGPGGAGFGTIAATVNHHVGFAEALVHEMAHHKLQALGVQFESAERLITNPAEQKFPSPIRYDCLRPMTAVLHAQYSYTYVSALDIHIINAGTDAERDRQIAAGSLAWNLPKLEFGLDAIGKYVTVDGAGADFMKGFYVWSERILKDGYSILERFQIPPQPFEHPLV